MDKILRIEITNNLIEFFLVDEDGEINDYSLNNHHSYFLDIQFDENTYKICTGNENGRKGLIIEFVSEIIENPESYTTYQVEFCGKEYQLTGECLLAIILNELISNSKKQLEDDKIERIEVEIMSDNDINVPLIAYLRIKSALKYIEYDNIETYCCYSEDTTSEEENDYEDYGFDSVEENIPPPPQNNQQLLFTNSTIKSSLTNR